VKPVVTDFQQFTALRTDARGGGDAALREAAEQFEAIFLQSMLKSMRDASMGDPIFGNSNGDFLTCSMIVRDQCEQGLVLRTLQVQAFAGLARVQWDR